jgi:arylsulfatase A-like enzyme
MSGKGVPTGIDRELTGKGLTQAESSKDKTESRRAERWGGGLFWLLPSVTALTGIGSAQSTAIVSSIPRPNIILILADDLGYCDLGCYGHPRFKTPKLDRMASEGVRLTQFNTPTPFCAPTRAALLTGRYPFRCGLTVNPAPDDSPAADARHLPLAEQTLAQLLHEAGYSTSMVGKWHLGHRSPEYLPTRRGFDEYFGIPYSNDMRPVRLLDGEKEIEYPIVQATLTRRYTERALRFIDHNRDRRFFLYFAQAMPHKPLACSEASYKKSGVGLYGDVMAELDWSVGQILEHVKELGLDERTLIIFTSDNGPWYGGSTGGLRGMKSTTWEGGLRVPCIGRWPGRLPAGKSCSALAVTMDLFATVLAAAGVPASLDRTIDGVDLLPILTGKQQSAHEFIVGQQGARPSTVRDARWKLHVLPAIAHTEVAPEARWLDPRGPDGVTILAPYEQAHPSQYPGVRTGDPGRAMALFDLENDPSEQHDVAAQHAEIVARLKARYDHLTKAAARSDRSGLRNGDRLKSNTMIDSSVSRYAVSVVILSPLTRKMALFRAFDTLAFRLRPNPRPGPS